MSGGSRASSDSVSTVSKSSWVPKDVFDASVKSAASRRARALGRRLTKGEMASLAEGIRAGWSARSVSTTTGSAGDHSSAGPGSSVPQPTAEVRVRVGCSRSGTYNNDRASGLGYVPSKQSSTGKSASKHGRFLSQIDFVKSGVLEHNPAFIDEEPTPPSSVPSQSTVGTWISDGSRVVERANAKLKLMQDTEFRIEFRKSMASSFTGVNQKLDLIRQFRVRFPEVDLDEFLFIGKKQPVKEGYGPDGSFRQTTHFFSFDSSKFEKVFLKTDLVEVAPSCVPRPDSEYSVTRLNLDDLT